MPFAPWNDLASRLFSHAVGDLGNRSRLICGLDQSWPDLGTDFSVRVRSKSQFKLSFHPSQGLGPAGFLILSIKSMSEAFAYPRLSMTEAFVTVMLVTSLCWWLYDGDWFDMVEAESLCWRLFSLCWWFFRCTKLVINILNRSPTS